MKRNRIVVPFAVLFLFYSLVCVRLYYLQVWKREDLSVRARKQWMRVSYTKPLKSTIYDSRGRPLVFSSFADSFYINPKKSKFTKETIALICDALELDTEELAKNIRNSKSYFMWLKRIVDPVQSEKLKKYNLKYVSCVKEKRRFYSEDKLASILLGLVGMDDQPLSGIEIVVDKMLKKNRVRNVSGRDAKGRMIDWDGSISINSPSGFVYLTIDKTIQYIAEKELGAVFEKYGAKWGCAIVQDVRTGDILAMAVFPRFSNNTPFEIRKVGQLHNLAIGQIFEPGSTFKIIPMAAAIEEDIFKVDDVFDCYNGKYDLGSMVIHDHKPRNLLTFREVVEYSSNIGIAQIGQGVGRERVYSYARAFGFGNKTGIMLPGEAKGNLKKPRYWSGVSLPVISFGQEISVTGIQLTSAYSAIANGGVLLEPQIISRVLNENKELVWESEPKRVRRVVSEKTAKLMTSILEGVVERGTGSMARVDGYTVAGKTGTSQKFDRELNKYSDENYVASFCGFLPAKNPSISIIVILDEPKGAYWGGVVAAPVFSRIARQVVSYLNISPDEINFVDILLSDHELAGKRGI